MLNRIHPFFTKMDDPNTFETFVQNVLNVTDATARNAITNFIPTMTDLMGTSDDEIESFVKTTHGANSGRNAGDKIVIQHSVVIGLQAMAFELRDRQKCDALPDQPTINAITTADMSVLRRERSAALRYMVNRKDTTPATMDVPEFKGTNFDAFMTAFKTLAARQIGANELPLDYLMREHPAGDYNAAYSTRENKLKACILFQGNNFKSDSEALYSLYVEHIGTQGIGSSTINKHKRSKNGYKCHLDFCQHYANKSYQDNKAQTALQNIAGAVYNGPKRNFNIETYYTIMSNAFNDLDTSGTAHALNDEQKIAKFEAGLKEPNAINFAIQAKAKYDSLPLGKSFDDYYNEFSALMTKYSTLSQTATGYSSRRSTINATSTNPSNTRSGRGRGRGRGRGSSSGRGKGKNSKKHHPYGNASKPSGFAATYGNFIPEAKIYPADIFNNLTPAQKKSISDLKSSQGWSNATTPPQGFTIDATSGKAVPSQSFIHAIRTATIAPTASFAPSYAPLPPVPGAGTVMMPPSEVNIPPPPPPRNDAMSEASMSRAGESFARSGNRTPSTNTSVNAVSINGQPYTGTIYDQYGRALN